MRHVSFPIACLALLAAAVSATAQEPFPNGPDCRFDALVTWMAEAWPIDQNVFVTNERLTDQLALHAASGLTRRFLIEEPDKPGRYVAFG